MRVLNVMLSRGRGGIESAFANYTLALKSSGIEVICCIAPGAAIKEQLGAEVAQVELAHVSQFDPLGIWRAYRLLRQLKPDVILVHARRGYFIFSLMQRIFGRRIPLVQVLHRTKFRSLTQADHVITVSCSLREEVIRRGMPAERVSYIPNFLPSLPKAASARPWLTPPVIGLLGRLVPEKGYDLFIEALAILRQRGIAFAAKIGGSGSFYEKLHAQAVACGVNASLEWLGWVHDPDTFYETIDIFCLPSRSESFGLVVLEAFAHGKPIVSTRSSGPSEIIDDGETGLLCEIDAQALADALIRVLQNPEMAGRLAANAMIENQRYTFEAVAPQIADCLTQVCKRFNET